MDYKFIDNHIELETVTKRPKKLTATRFATIMNLNAWSTPFSAWCEMTRTYEKPFEDTIYTIAGKTIEPKICEYLRRRYFMKIKSPEDVYGKDYFKITYGDFFPDVKALGGMWDFLGDDFVVEVKTTKRSEDWRDANGNIEPPIYYKLQACLYAYLLGFDDVVMTCSFLKDEDYENPDAFVPTVDNTAVIEFKLSDAFPNFEKDYVKPALEFWNKNVLTGISPDFDEKKDSEILKELRKNVVESDADLTKMIKEADKLKAQIDKAEAKMSDKKKRLKELDNIIKKEMIPKFREGDKHLLMKGTKYMWDIRRDITESFNKTKFAKEHPDVYTQYTENKPKYVLTKKEMED